MSRELGTAESQIASWVRAPASTRLSVAAWAWRGLVVLAAVVGALLVFEAPLALAGTVSFFPNPVKQMDVPDTRGGMVMDDRYVWISDHKGGLWRVDRCTGANAGDVSGSDSSSWDLWWYDPYGNYPANPGAGFPAGYFIYEAGANGMVYIFNTSFPAVAAGSFNTQGGVAYGIYATEPASHTLYVATTGGLKVYDISNPETPVPVKTLLPSLDFSSVRGIVGHPYVYANSLTDSTTYVIDVSTNTVISTIAYGAGNSMRRPWVYQPVDSPEKTYLYAVNDSGDLWISDVTNPRNPTIVAVWNSPAGGASNMPGGSVYVQKDYAFVLTSSGNDRGYVYMLDVRDPANPSLVDTLYDAAFGYNDLRLDGCEIHIAAHDGWKMYRMQGWQPDAQISNTDTSNWSAADVYESLPTVGIKTQTIEPGGTAVFQVYLANDADRRDRIALQGSSVPAGWTVQYTIRGVDVTAAVLSGSYISGYLEPGQGFLVTVRATAGPGATGGTTLENLLTSRSWMCMESSCGGPKDVVEGEVTVGAPSLEVSKDDGQIYLMGGGKLTYEITYGNSGDGTAAGVVLTDVLPPGLTYESAVPAPSSVVPNSPGAGQTTLVWDVGNLPPNGGRYTIKVNATAALSLVPGTSLTNTVAAQYRDLLGTPYAAVSEDDVDQVSDRLLKKTVDKTHADFGDILTFTLTPSYPGDQQLRNVRVVDALPLGTTYVAGSANAGGSYGGYVPLPAQPGHDDGPPVLDTAITTSSSVVQPGGSVTVTLNVKSSVAIGNVSPTTLRVSGGAHVVTSGPIPASANVPAGGSGANFAWNVKLEDAGEYVFSAGAEDGTAAYQWPEASSAACSAPPAVRAWSRGAWAAPPLACRAPR